MNSPALKHRAIDSAQQYEQDVTKGELAQPLIKLNHRHGDAEVPQRILSAPSLAGKKKNHHMTGNPSWLLRVLVSLWQTQR